MDEVDIQQRRIQLRQGSYVVTIPHGIALSMGVKQNRYARFAVVGDKIVIKLADSGITKRDLAEAGKGSAHLDAESGGWDGDGHLDELDKALQTTGGEDGDGKGRQPSRARITWIGGDVGDGDGEWGDGGDHDRRTHLDGDRGSGNGGKGSRDLLDRLRMK